MKDLGNLKEYTDKVTLSSGEKFDMLQNLRAYADTRPARSRYAIFVRHSVVYAGMLSLLIGTSITSYAAEGSLPGDLLYPIKTNINETVIQSLAFSKTQKAEITVNLMEKRMGELERMIVEERDDPEKIDLIVAKLEEHKSDLQEITEEIEPSNPEQVQEATEVYAKLESVIDTHIDILQDIAKDGIVNDVYTETQDTNETENIQSESAIEQKDTQPDDTVSMTRIPDPGQAMAEFKNTPLTGEEDAINELVNFSSRIDPLIDSIQSKASKDALDDSTRIKIDVRNRILERVDELNDQIEAGEN